MSNVFATAMDRIKKSYHDSPAVYQSRIDSGAARVDPGWELLAAGNAFYFVMLYVLYTAFKDNKKDPKMIMRLYNLSCVCLAGTSAYGVIKCMMGRSVNFVGNQNMLLEKDDEAVEWLVFANKFFYYQKYWEFLDTFIFLIRNSYRQVSFLHVYHHSSITIIVFLYTRYDNSGDIFLPILLNSLVHVMMYGHYFLSTIGVKNAPWKAHLTTMQLVQFLLIAAQSFMSWSQGPDRGFPDWLKAIMIVYMGTMLFLFGKFFVASYMAPKKKAVKKAE